MLIFFTYDNIDSKFIFDNVLANLCFNSVSLICYSFKFIQNLGIVHEICP